MKRTLLDNFGLKLIALLLAALAWVYVNLGVNPQVTRTIAVPLKVLNPPPSTYVKELPPTCEFTVTAGRRDFIVTGPQSLAAYLDLTSAVPGRRNRIAVTDNLPPNMRVRARNPDFEIVEPILLSTRKIPVRAAIVGATKPRYYHKDAIVTPDAVHVTGPKHYIDFLEPLTLEVSLAGRADDLEETRPVYADGDRVPGFSCDVPAVKIRVPVMPLPTKDIPVELTVTGKVSEGFEIQSRGTEPDKVTIQGPPDLIARIKKAPTEPFDVTGISTGRSAKVKILLERTEGVFLERTEVQALVGVSERSMRRTFRAVPLRVTCPDEYEVRLARSSVDLELTGPMNTLKDLDPSAIEAIVRIDRTGKALEFPLEVIRPANYEWKPRLMGADVWIRAGSPEHGPRGAEYGPPAPPRGK